MVADTSNALHPLVPPFILSNAAAGNLRGRFNAVGLFADVSGFSAMTDALMAHGQHGAEVLAGVMRAALDPLIRAVFEWGGFIAAQAGDSVTALFSAEDEAGLWNALAAGWAILQRTAARPTFITPYGEFTVSVKVGLAYGEVAWGILPSGDGRRAAYYFSGRAVDGCAEAQSLAHAGEAILDAELNARLHGQVETVPLAGQAAGAYYRLGAVHAGLPAPREVVPQPIDLALAGRFFPAALFTQAAPGEFRQITYLFVRLPTVRTEDQLEKFMHTVFDLQDRYGGLLKLYFGDKGAHLFLLWGAPLAYENDIQRALNFILDLQTQTAIPINGGITHRVAHAGFVGSPLSEEYTGYGRGANLAARFMTAAPRGELWVDENIARRAQSAYALDYLGEKAFKGFGRPQKVYLLLERKEQDEIAYEGELVGRDAELQALQEFVGPIFAGQFAGMMLVAGEPGMGKSRLVHEYLARLEGASPDAFQFFLAQTDEILRQSLNPFRYWLRRYFGVSEMQVESRNKRSFNRKLDELIAATPQARLAEELDHTRSFLGALVGLTWPDSLYEQMDAEARFDNTLIGLIALLCAESLQKPVIFFLEDVHYLDDDTRAFLPRLLRALAVREAHAEGESRFPIALLATGRGDERELRLQGLPVARIHLDQLGRSGLYDLAARCLQGPPAASLLDFLELRAQGNPFFVEQILKYLQDGQLLSYQNAGRNPGWALKSAQEARLPIDLQGVLVARLDRLTQQVKEIVQTAAVLGREFEVRLLAEMLQGDDHLNEKVRKAAEEDIWAALSEIRYIFRHTMLREAAYSMQVEARRRMLHTLALDGLERLHAADLAPHYGELAYHAEQGGMVEKARRYLKLAGDAAVQVFHNTQAIDYYRRALALTPADDLRARFGLLAAHEDLCQLLGLKGPRRQDLDGLGQIAQTLGDADLQLEWLLKEGEYHLDTGEFSAGQALAEDLIHQAQAAGDERMVVNGLVQLTLFCFRQARYEHAIAHARAGLELARRLEDHRNENSLLNALGLIAVEQRDIGIARRYFDACLLISQQAGNLRFLGRTLNNLGMVSGYLSDYIASRRYYEQSLAYAREVGSRTDEGLVLGNLGWVTGALGDYAQGREYVEHGLRIARETGDLYSETYALINLSAFSGAQGDYETARRSAEQALALTQASGDRSARAWAWTYLGHSLLALRRPAEAQRAYRTALDLRHTLDQSTLAAEPAAGLAQAALDAGDPQAALDHLADPLALIESGNTLEGCDEPLRVYWTCYSVLQAHADGRAVGVLRAAHDLLQARALHIPEGEARQAFMNSNAHHQLISAAWAQD